MDNSSLEITEQLYHLKLSRKDFDLSFINQLLKRIQAEQAFFSFTKQDSEEDIISRQIDTNARFDNLNEK